MAFGNQGQQGFNNPSEIFANILKLIGPNAEIIGPDFIINKNGFFFYNGTPASGNLLYSWTQTAPSGVDNFGNTTYPGFVSYVSGVVTQIDQGAALFFDPSFLPANKAHTSIGAVGAATQELVLTSGNVVNGTDTPATIGLISSTTPEILIALDFSTVMVIQRAADGGVIINSTLNIPQNGLAHFGVDIAGQIYLISNGPAGTTRAIAKVASDADNRWQIDDSGKMQWGSGAAALDTTLQRQAAGELLTGGQFDCQILFAAVKAVLANQSSAPAALAGQTQIVGSNADLPFSVGGNGTAGFLQAASQADTTAHTVTAATFTNFGGVWTIPAGSANGGDFFELDAIGHGTEGTTAQALRFGLALNGTIISMATIAAPAAASGLFSIKIKARFVALVSGSFAMEIECLAGAGGTSTPVTNLTEATGSWTPANANTLAIQVEWVSTTGAPTVTCDANTFRKVA